MKKLVPVLLLGLTLAVQAQEPSASLEFDQQAFTQAQKVGGARVRAFFVFRTSDRRYTIRHDGYTEAFHAVLRRRPFPLKMGPNTRVERVYFLEFEQDLLLLYEVSNGTSGWAYLIRLDQVARRPKWVTPVSGINVGPPIVEGSYAYLSSVNMFAKIDVHTGRYAWKQADFEKKFASEFDDFQLPMIDGDRILFQEQTERARTIEIDKTTGEILKLRQ